MATAHWRTGFTVADLYQTPDAGWSFYQLVRLLLSEQAALTVDASATEADKQEVDKQEVGAVEAQLAEQLERRFFFKAIHQGDFPAGEVRAIKQAANDDTADEPQPDNYHIACLGNHISGISGPLPDGLNEWVINDLKQRDGVLPHFLDLFNHRLQSLRYLFRSLSDASLTHLPCEQSEQGQMALALSGNLLALHRQLYQQSADRFIGQAGGLANRRMSVPMVQQLFASVAQLPLKRLSNFIGRWLDVEPEDHIRLGQRNNRLGGEATLGRRVWDQQAAIGIVLGPLPAARLKALLPEGDEYPQLHQLLCWVTDRKCDCQITLESELGVSEPASLDSQHNQLGRLSRLGQREGAETVTFMVKLAGAAL
ncbi:type VI secretion system baseplate subunit TssG [Aliagarivorans marinus]|uniref:type VI secretion system baseplate subunit TssG n=1 Tax=Aliagarivorans marinus TaxID=561965 RepID=UPI00040F3DC3|nr:type VI secretion system baseplate subunit TssG [Aliagarivorans marinus]